MTEPPRRDADRRPPYGGTTGAAAGARGGNADPRGRAQSWPAPPGDAYARRRPAPDAYPGQPRRRDGQPSPARDGQPRTPAPSDGYRRRPPPGRGPRLWGTLPGRAGVYLVIGSAAVGALITALARSEPGLVLGLCVVAGTLAAALAVHPRAVYRIIPAPALSYLVAAVLAGMIHDRANGTSSTALAVGATQWIASGFVAMTAATLLAIVITAARFRAGRRGPRRPGGHPPGQDADSPRRGPAAGRRPPALRGRYRDDPEYRAPAAGRLPRDDARGS